MRKGILEAICVVAVIFLAYYFNLDNVSFHKDESHWIATSYYFEALWTDDLEILGDAAQNVWEPQYWTLTQPPVGRYLIALGRLAGGYGEKDLNTPWNFRKDVAENEALGNMPSSDLLMWSRLPMIILASFSGLMLFSYLKEASGRLAAYIFLSIYISLDYFKIMLSRAMGESALLFFTLLGILAGLKMLASWTALQDADEQDGIEKRRKILKWAALVGVFTGLAGASKLNGLVLLFAFAWLVFVLYFRTMPANIVGKQVLLISTVSLGFLATFAVFVFVNPYLYPNPIERITLMLLDRVAEMSIQVSQYPAAVIPDVASRLTIIPQRLFRDYSLFKFRRGIFFNVLLGLIGGYDLFSKKKLFNAVFIGMLGVLSIPPLLTPLDWDRYYLFPVILVSLFVGTGIAASFDWMLRLVSRKKRSS